MGHVRDVPQGDVLARRESAAPTIASGIDENPGQTLGLAVVAVADLSNVVFGPGAIPQAAVAELYNDMPSVLVGSDGSSVALRRPVADVAFSPDPTTSTMALQFTDGLTDLWDRGASATIGSLGLGVGETVFDGIGDRAAVRYLTGTSSLIDLEWLRSLPAGGVHSIWTTPSLRSPAGRSVRGPSSSHPWPAGPARRCPAGAARASSRGCRRAPRDRWRSAPAGPSRRA